MINKFTIPEDQVVFVSLGGAGEIGMNMYLYGYDGQWLMVDCGVTFSHGSLPAMDVVLPDPTFISGYGKSLIGLVITHGHEDHLGAVGWLWPQLRCPVYTTPFTAALLNRKLAEVGLEYDVPVHPMALGGQLTLGPFAIEFVPLTHSIPEPVALAIRTSAGTIVHSGDWKFDPAPMVGRVTDIAALARLGTEGVMAMIGDSTNVFTMGSSGSEADVRASLTRLFANVESRIAVTCFASNIARLESITVAATANGRKVALLGRSLWRLVEAAQQLGYLSSLCFHTAQDMIGLPQSCVLYVCTGSQGEPRAALARVAALNHPYVRLGHGDMVVFSSRIIPGNERAIHGLHNQFVRLGARVVTECDYFVHVSGHPGQPEMAEMYQLVRPRLLVPIHGEMRHLVAHADLVRSYGMASMVVENGQMITLGPAQPSFLGTVPVGKMIVDGHRLIPSDSQIFRSRKRMVFNGFAALTLVVDSAGHLLHDPQLTASSVLNPEEEENEGNTVVAAVRAAISRLSIDERCDDDSIRAAARSAMRRSFQESLGKKPLTEVHLVRM
ncbi:Metallo-beta-lactamase family protein, RNA-specific [invertebrate metagenome]|uniref:Metallo-beta-lactamase family protein, RNA-specific n=1 Tax=invertebrate metagenome TaxID=1711999 RepID=A0A484H5J8_9ZZZZ